MRQLLHLVEKCTDSSELYMQGTNGGLFLRKTVTFYEPFVWQLPSYQALLRSSFWKMRCLHSVASDPQSCQSFGKNTASFFTYLLYLFFFYCTVTLLAPALVFAYSSQLPPSHPAAPPEHLKEPLAYMRKAQVSLSPLISVTPHSFFIYLSDSFFFPLPNSEM